MWRWWSKSTVKRYFQRSNHRITARNDAQMMNTCQRRDMACLFKTCSGKQSRCGSNGRAQQFGEIWSAQLIDCNFFPRSQMRPNLQDQMNETRVIDWSFNCSKRSYGLGFIIHKTALSIDNLNFGAFVIIFRIIRSKRRSQSWRSDKMLHRSTQYSYIRLILTKTTAILHTGFGSAQNATVKIVQKFQILIMHLVPQP